jgi:TRAP transporter 4TM/12TM fusion protein
MNQTAPLSAEDIREILQQDREQETLEQLRESAFPKEQRKPRGFHGLLVTVLAVAICSLTLWMAFNVTFGPIATRAVHLVFVIPLAFLVYPTLKRWSGQPHARPMWIDYIGAAIASSAFIWAIYSADRLTFRRAYVDPIEWPDILFGTIAILATFEAARRTVGMTIVYITLFFMIYALAGPYFPGLFQHAGTEYIDLIETLYMMPDGIFNFITGTMATFVFTFLTFGAFLRVSGGDRVFTSIALALAGDRQGGPAKVAVISSAMMGSISGSTVSNVVTTGAFTIPMMKRLGFKPYEAAAIETTASLGGALMPPMMGAGVFIMASFTGLPLLTILGYSVAPALLYFVSLYFYVDVKSRKKNLQGLPRDVLPKIAPVLRQGGHIFLPIILLVYLLYIDYSPFYASAAAVLGVLVVSQFRKSTRMGPRKVLVALEAATRVTLSISALGACAAMMYGVLSITGMLGKVTSMLLAFSDGSLLIALVLVALISYVMGMGLPVTAAYVLLAALGSPALQDLGLTVLAAHLVIFWFSQDSTITPPVCMTAFVAARMAHAPPMKTGWQSVMMAKGLYIIPFAFAYCSLLDENIVEVLFDTAALFFLFALMPMVIEGFYFRAIGWLVRAVLLAASVGMFVAAMGPMADGYGWFAASLALAVLALGFEYRQTRAAPGVTAAPG